MLKKLTVGSATALAVFALSVGPADAWGGRDGGNRHSYKHRQSSWSWGSWGSWGGSWGSNHWGGYNCKPPVEVPDSDDDNVVT
jgi:hypothetical protein